MITEKCTCGAEFIVDATKAGSMASSAATFEVNAASAWRKDHRHEPRPAAQEINLSMDVGAEVARQLVKILDEARKRGDSC